MGNILEWFNGKKTYIVAILTGIGGILSAFGVVIPESVWLILGALGLGAVRDAIAKK